MCSPIHRRQELQENTGEYRRKDYDRLGVSVLDISGEN